jgi:16S rRNA processing protein RimM
MNDLVAIAKVAKPRGIKGETVAVILTDFPERFEGLDEVIAVLPMGETRKLTIESHWFQSGRVILKFAGIDSMNEAESLRNAEICVVEDEIVELESDEYYDWQLEGCVVIDAEDRVLGTVSSVMRTAGTELLAVRGVDREHLIPFVEAICIEVDIDGKRIVIDPPEGLLDM